VAKVAQAKPVVVIDEKVDPLSARKKKKGVYVCPSVVAAFAFD
jgi:hypothetical protein